MSTRKKKGARGDSVAQRWYTTEYNKLHQELIDTFHSSNFYDDRYGTHYHSHLKTEAQRKGEGKENSKRFNKLRKEWIKGLIPG